MVRAQYRQRRDALLDGLAGSPDLEVAGIAAGLHILLRFPPHVDADRLARDCRSLGLAARSLDRYRHAPGPPGVVLGYSHMKPGQLRSAAARLARALERERAAR